MIHEFGSVIALNGASSSGKTTIAKALQAVLPESHLHLSLDAFLHQLPAPVLADAALLAGQLPQLLAGFNASCAAIARAGNNIVVDTVLHRSQRGWFRWQGCWPGSTPCSWP